MLVLPPPLFHTVSMTQYLWASEARGDWLGICPSLHAASRTPTVTGSAATDTVAADRPVRWVRRRTRDCLHLIPLAAAAAAAGGVIGGQDGAASDSSDTLVTIEDLPPPARPRGTVDASSGGDDVGGDGGGSADAGAVGTVGGAAAAPANPAFAVVDALSDAHDGVDIGEKRSLVPTERI